LRYIGSKQVNKQESIYHWTSNLSFYNEKYEKLLGRLLLITYSPDVTYGIITKYDQYHVYIFVLKRFGRERCVMPMRTFIFDNMIDHKLYKLL
jgi:hypothetical protein